MTKAELLELLADYPDDARIVVSNRIHGQKGSYIAADYVVEFDAYRIDTGVRSRTIAFGDWLNAKYGNASKESEKVILIDTWA